MLEIAKTIDVAQLVKTFGHRKDVLRKFLEFLPHDFRWHLLNQYMSDEHGRQYAEGVWANQRRKGLDEVTRASIFAYFGPMPK